MIREFEIESQIDEGRRTPRECRLMGIYEYFILREMRIAQAERESLRIQSAKAKRGKY